jgi:dimethylhistidine N-methyltransferase
LSARKKALPAFLFYDAAGSALFEQITELPEYYLTRTERSIFERDGDAIAKSTRALLTNGSARPTTLLELGAGSATKTEILLSAFTRAQGKTRFYAADVSASPLEELSARLALSSPLVELHPLVASHAEALSCAARVEGPLLTLFIGSSIGNYGDDEAAALLSDIARAIGPRGALLLGTDLRKSLDVLLPAYDDAAGVTAEFNKNVLARINRDLSADFALDRFRHVARWNESESAIEMHLASVGAQRVHIGDLEMTVDFADGETIHTESSHKYDIARVDSLFRRAGLRRAQTFQDDRGWFALHLGTTK